jgi:RimJ/RimL family protein N-acetyltransferase
LRLKIVNAKETPLTIDEIKDIVEIESHPKVREWLTTHVDPNSKRAVRAYKRFFKKLPRRERADILLARYDGKVVGFLALWGLSRDMRHVASIGISVNPDYWGKRVATRLMKSAIRLAKKRKLRRLEIETLSDNTAMRHLAEKTGFKLERIRKDRVLKDGEYHDEASYFMLL